MVPPVPNSFTLGNPGVTGNCFFRDLVVGLLVAGLNHMGHGTGVDADVVTGDDLLTMWVSSSFSDLGSTVPLKLRGWSPLRRYPRPLH
jgi:hypothetical protein